ncbi:NAD-glutamate dehydrogenase [Chromobacterium haemolyticum]|nr:NAD-glutamate dehydrogenase [Chromobacterium haemolyticum]
MTDTAILKQLESELNRVLSDIRLVVSDEPTMREVLADISKDLSLVKGKRAAEAKEAVDFLAWMSKRNFLFMGYCDYDLVRRNGKDSLKIVKTSGLGILKDQGDKEYSASFEQLPQELRELAHLPQLIILNKSQTRSIIHRPAYIDFVGIKRFNDKGEVIGERRFLGVCTLPAPIRTRPRMCPSCARKWRQ